MSCCRYNGLAEGSFPYPGHEMPPVTSATGHLEGITGRLDVHGRTIVEDGIHGDVLVPLDEAFVGLVVDKGVRHVLRRAAYATAPAGSGQRDLTRQTIGMGLRRRSG